MAIRNHLRSAWIACALLALSAPVPAQDWKKDWERTLQAARKEGQLAIYIYRYEPML
jgi:hypothetical protein